MQLQGLCHDDGLQEVALELVHADHDRQDDEGDDRPVRNERDEGGEDPGDRGTDYRDEGAARNTMTASGSASGTCRMARPMPMAAASTNAMTAVPRR